jgi:hypothetical protein
VLAHVWCPAERSDGQGFCFKNKKKKKKKQTRGEQRNDERSNILIFGFEVFLLGHDASSMMQENHFSLLLLLLLGVSIRTGDLVCRPAISHHCKKEKEKEKLLEHLSILKKRKSEYIQGRRRRKTNRGRAAVLIHRVD